MPRIIPIKDLKNTALISQLCESSNEPIYVTKNGYNHLIVMQQEAYEEQFALLDLLKKLYSAEKSVAKGLVEDAHLALEDIRAEFGL